MLWEQSPVSEHTRQLVNPSWPDSVRVQPLKTSLLAVQQLCASCYDQLKVPTPLPPITDPTPLPAPPASDNQARPALIATAAF